MNVLSRRQKSGLLPIALLIVALVLLLPLRSEAYAGPGAGFAVLSSFWTIFVAFLYSFYALVTWPIRQLLRLFRRRKAYGKAQVKRVVIVGFDGMDPELASRFMSEGKLPNLAKLRDSGTFRPLRTTFPAISPVAWSTFQTGVNPGKHNIYDFLARDLKNYLPYLSSAQISEPKRHLRIGKYSLPLGKSEVKGLRKGTPFWHWLGKAGVFCSVIRVPVTFPPEKFPGVLLSGMCVPDLEGKPGDILLLHHAARAAISFAKVAYAFPSNAMALDFIPIFRARKILWARAASCAPTSRFAQMWNAARRGSRSTPKPSPSRSASTRNGFR